MGLYGSGDVMGNNGVGGAYAAMLIVKTARYATPLEDETQGRRTQPKQ